MALEFTISLNYVFGHIVQTVQNGDLCTTDRHTMKGQKIFKAASLSPQKYNTNYI